MNEANEAVIPVITRQEECALYAFLREQTDGDSLRYELIAKKIHRVASAWHSKDDEAVVRDWLSAMRERDAVRAAREAATVASGAGVPFDSLRSGECGNPSYQAFLDTLEQDELDALSNNVPYFAFVSARQAEASSAGRENDLAAYIREWADAHLSLRVREQLGEGAAEFPRQR